MDVIDSGLDSLLKYVEEGNDIFVYIPITPFTIDDTTISQIKVFDYISYITRVDYFAHDLELFIDSVIKKHGRDKIKDLTIIDKNIILNHSNSYLITSSYHIIMPYVSESDEKKTCEICYNDTISLKFKPCGHKCCPICYFHIVEMGKRCHICRGSIESGKLIN